MQQETIGPEEPRMRGKQKMENLREIAFERDRSDQLPVVNEASRSASWGTKRPLARRMMSEY